MTLGKGKCDHRDEKIGTLFVKKRQVPVRLLLFPLFQTQFFNLKVCAEMQQQVEVFVTSQQWS